MLSLRRIIRTAGVYFPPFLGGLVLVATIVDISLYDNTLFVESVLKTAKANKASLSVVISALLLFAYILQFLSQHLQRKIMTRQETLMNAGFTPILGVTNHEFGYEIDGETKTQEEKNRLFLDVINNGNATARDLRIWFGISYEGACRFNPLIWSDEVRLTRKEDGAWWPADTGGALSNSSEFATRFVCEPKLKCRCMDWYVPKLLNSYDEIPIHKALKKLEEKESEEFRLAMVLRYKTTVGNEEEVPITGFKANPGKIGEDYLLYSAQEHNSEVKNYIKQAR